MNPYNEFYSSDDATVDLWTKGRWSLSRHTINTLLRAASNILTVIIRRKEGTNRFSIGKLFWMIVLLTFAWLMAYVTEFGTLRSLTKLSFESTHLIYMHGLLVIICFMVKWVIAVLSIGTTSSWFRKRNAMGGSIFWPIIGLFLRPLRLAPKRTEAARFYQISERKWMLFFEPILLLFIASWWHAVGCSTYGNLLFIATLALVCTTFWDMKNKDMKQQLTQEANQMAR